MYVRDILQEKGVAVVTVTPDVRIGDFAKRLVDHRIGAVVVTGADGVVVGMMSERDMIYGVAERGAACLDEKVETLMSTDVLSVTESTTIDDVMSMMTRRRCRHLPVLADGTLVGIVSIGDVVKYRIREAEEEANQLREYINA